MIKKITQFSGRHYETGSIQNALALQGVKAPHTGRTYSEAFFLGVSGGIAFGYFTFEYKGFLPHLAILTRNTFDPFQTILERLGVVQHVYQTSKAEIAGKNLVEALAGGNPALVWADECSLPYTNKIGAAYWNMIPIVVYEIDGDDALIADRSSRPFRVPMDILAKARARVKDDKFRVITLESPQTSKLAAATQKGIWQCISLFTDKPPKGARHNFGFAAYEHLADMLTNTRNKQSWERLFAVGPRMYNALAGTVESRGVFAPPGAFSWINTFGAGDGAERALYADFLDEASILLEKKSLKDAASQFRLSHIKWLELADALLPSSVPAFQGAKTLLLRKHHLFVEDGEDAVDEIVKINSRLKKLEADMAKDFPLTQAAAAEMRENLREHILGISEIEHKAIELLQGSMK
ncbi:MAG TPA: BtrH N-terminal domain-containing protein [Anaerolineales bacterium]|nr:BtrH N-terminal domain-containing protein [Anaerolineales bacterium]